MQSIDNSLRSLGVDALDLVQFYWHDYGAQKYVPAAQRLAELQEAGKIRHIGVTNFDVPRLDEILQGGVRVVSNQASCSGLGSQKVLMHHVHNVRGASTKQEWNVACILATSGSPGLWEVLISGPSLASLVVRAVQVQYSLLDRRPENYMIPYCKEHNIKLLPYGTVAGGFLSEHYLGVPASK